MNSYVDNNIITLHIMAEGEGQGKPVSKQMQPVILYPWLCLDPWKSGRKSHIGHCSIL
jgi:hypothetical protein